MQESLSRVIEQLEEKYAAAVKRADYNAYSDWAYAIDKLEEVINICERYEQEEQK